MSVFEDNPNPPGRPLPFDEIYHDSRHTDAEKAAYLHAICQEQWRSLEKVGAIAYTLCHNALPCGVTWLPQRYTCWLQDTREEQTDEED